VARLARLIQGRNLVGSSLRASLCNWATRGDSFIQILVLLFQIHKIGNVQEGIAFQSNVDECRLHAGKHARHTAFVDGTR